MFKGPKMGIVSHKMAKFSKAELEELPVLLARAAEAAVAFVESGMAQTMNKFN